jgi:nucleotide-binding universal stress UspA family protein
MSIFPAKILLATDGSLESELALSTAIDLANSTSSELHVVHVVGLYHPDLLTLRDPALFEERLQGLEQETEEVFNGQVRKIEEAGGDRTRSLP